MARHKPAVFQGTNAGGPEPRRGSNHCSYRARCPVLGWGATSVEMKRWKSMGFIHEGWKRGEVGRNTCFFLRFLFGRWNEFVWSCFFLTIEAFVVCRLFFGIITFDNSPRLFGYVKVCQLAALFFFHVARCPVFLHVGPWFWAPNIMVYALQCERCVACAWRWVGQALEELGGVLSGWMIRWTVQEHIKSTEKPWWMHEFHLK